MAVFTPGWYVVQPRDAQGHTQLKYFARRDRVTCACYTTADGRQVYLWGETERPGGVADTWRPSYVYRPSDADGQWDAAQPAAALHVSNSVPRSACEDRANACPACDRKGLLILPLRYAVARADVPGLSAAPALADPFASGDDGIVLPADLAHYTLRTLRSGYLYVFNESWGRQGWTAYTVDAQGYLGEFDIHAKSPPLPDVLANAPCGRRATAELARCIAIADAHLPERLGTVWLSFSATPWTAALVRRH
uniref:toxin VasX n=1 Tax=Herbaspirillum sp. TaxID=1890675 RepID=UPI0031DE2C17